MIYVFLLSLHIVEVLCGTQLVDGPTPLQGRVEAEIFGQNQSICSLGFDSRAANVICSSLGYRGATQLWRYSKFGAGNMPLYSRLITCLGNESSLDMCNHSSIHILGCDNSTVVGVECQATWGFATTTLPGTLLGNFRNHVACKGSETSVSECNGVLGSCREPIVFRPLGPPSCLTYEKKALLCSDYILQGLRLGPDGILLMQINGRQWAVNEDEFIPQTAEAACKIMGHKGFKTFRTELSGPKDVEVLGSLICYNNGARLEDCHLRHIFSKRPYDLSVYCDICVKHVVLTCHNGTQSDFGPAFVG